MKTWALVVGLNRYPAQTGFTNPLKGAVADACDFADWALDVDGGNVAPERLAFWTYPKPDSPTEAVQAYLKTPLPWYDPDADGPIAADFTKPPPMEVITNTALKAANDAAMHHALTGEATRGYIFFAGHGVQTTTYGDAARIQTCFVTRDFRPNAMTVMGLIPCDDLKQALLNNGFGEVAMFLDCCRLGDNAYDRAIPALGSKNIMAPAEPKWGLGVAAQKNKAAFETTYVPYRGVFSRVLLNGLRTHRDGGATTLTIDGLRQYVKDNVASYTTEDQRPSITSDPDDGTMVVVDSPPRAKTDGPAAKIVIDFDAAAFGANAAATLVDHLGRPCDGPFALDAPPLVVSAATLAVYGIDVSIDGAPATYSKIVDHKGPEDSRVVLEQ